MDRPDFLAALDDLARRIATRAPGARVAFLASAPTGDWGVYFNGAPLYLGHTPDDLAAAHRDLDRFNGIRHILADGPHLYSDGARVRPIPTAGGPVAEA